MKRIFPVIALFWLWGSVSAQNLVKDGDFESPGKWWYDGPKTQNPPAFEFIRQDAYNGKSCMKVNTYAWNRCIKFEKGKTYRISVAVKCRNCPENGFALRITDTKYSKNWLYCNRKKDLITSGGTHDWKVLRFTVTPKITGKGAEGFLYLYNVKRSGEVYVDALEIIKAPIED